MHPPLRPGLGALWWWSGCPVQANTQRKLSKKQRSDAALEVCWGHCVGSATFQNHKLVPIAPQLDGTGFERWVRP